MPAELHIASLLVHVRPERVASVRECIAAMPGAEFHVEQSGKMVVTLEGPHEGWVADRMSEINLIDGVLSAVLVFHHVDPETDPPETEPPKTDPEEEAAS